MAGFVTAFPDSLKAELAKAIHDFSTGGDIFKCALGVATPLGTFDETTTNYSQLGVDELPTGNGYMIGGFVWLASQNITPALGGTTALWSWSVNPSWAGATFSSSGCLIYNSSKGNRAVYVGSFGSIKTGNGNPFSIILPVYDPSTSILRLI